MKEYILCVRSSRNQNLDHDITLKEGLELLAAHRNNYGHGGGLILRFSGGNGHPYIGML